MTSKVLNMLRIVAESNIQNNIENLQVKSYMTNVDYSNASNDYSFSHIQEYVVTTPYRKDIPKPVSLRWTKTNCTSIYIDVSLDSGFSSYVTFAFSPSIYSALVYNLVPSSLYYYRVKADTTVIKTGTLHTYGRERMIYVDGVFNVRDIGGWSAYNGMKIKYGKVYRGSALANTTGTLITANGISTMRDIMEIRYELDFRQTSEVLDTTHSVLGEDVTYTMVEIGGYASGIASQVSMPNILRIIFAQAQAGVPIYCHCAGGADRTGSVMFLIEGILGMSESDLCKDWELTSFSTYGIRRRDSTEFDYKGMVDYIKALSGTTLTDKFVTYCTSRGITQTEINDFRNAMLA